MPRYAEMPKLRELYARLITHGARVRFVYHPPGEPVGLRRIYMYDREGYDVGTLVWQVCDACRHGSINKVSITLEYQCQGFGRRLILRALSKGPATTGPPPANHRTRSGSSP